MGLPWIDHRLCLILIVFFGMFWFLDWFDPVYRPDAEEVRWRDPEESYSEDDTDNEEFIHDMKDKPRLLLPGSSSERMDSINSDESTAPVVASLTDKWEEQEAQVERRRNRRRKQSVEAAMELGRQRRDNQHRWPKSFVASARIQSVNQILTCITRWHTKTWIASNRFHLLVLWVPCARLLHVDKSM